MNDLLVNLIRMALLHKTSDIHFVLATSKLEIKLKTIDGIEKVHQDIWTCELFEYLKFISGFDLVNPFKPQSGRFSIEVDNKTLFCRFSVIFNNLIQTGVLRILQTNPSMKIQDLTQNTRHIEFLESLTNCRQGLVISSGPTSSGKTTTLHALLHEIALKQKYNVVSLEDPIEIEDDLYLQLQINESLGFTYEKGIEELLRHDPDVILIGECRNAYTAKMVVRAALTGHLVFTTIHAKNGLETIQRLLDFGLTTFDLKNTLTAVISQRLYKSSDDERKECVYEILSQNELEYALSYQEYSKDHLCLEDEISNAIKNGYIIDEQANFDIQDFKR